MLNGLSNNMAMKLPLLLFVTSISMAAFAIGENPIGSVFPLGIASTAPSPSSSNFSPAAAIITITDDAHVQDSAIPISNNKRVHIHVPLIDLTGLWKQ